MRLRHLRWWKRKPTLGKPTATLTPSSTYQLVGGQIIHNVHPLAHCLGRPCCVHHPTPHHMSTWPQNYRDDSGAMERVCPHGVGHPDPDHLAWVKHMTNAQVARWHGVHGCDGCCTNTETQEDST